MITCPPQVYLADTLRCNNHRPDAGDDRSGSTGISGVIQSGNGSILANIRESHMEAEPLLYEILDQFGTVGFTGILDVGSPNRSLFGVPVTTNYQGVVMIGGANPVAAFIESGRWAETTAMKGLIPVSRLVHIDDIE
ncbi:NrpR regulatory domain-containing protein [Methanogenium cariaci]|uniref:NrpR regulatory domain-containing protein n=1 Tax=Methanogenium cariaci TaxID=2197 RepID=UPI002480F013|nr:NrpR regulatory domain-containing protein [Methanogenium cariaci]